MNKSELLESIYAQQNILSSFPDTFTVSKDSLIGYLTKLAQEISKL